MSKKVLVTLLKYVAGLLLLAWVVWRYWKPAEGTGLQDALQRQINFGPLAIGCGICALALLLTFVRWWLLVRAQDLPFAFPQALRLGFIGYYLSAFLPGSVGGDIFKAAFLAKDQKRRTVAVATVVIDRIMGLAGLIWLVAVLGAVFWLAGTLTHYVELQYIFVIAAGLALGMMVFWILVGRLSTDSAFRLAGWLHRLPKIGPSLAEAGRACWIYRQRSGSIGVAMLLSMIGHVGFVLTYYFASLTLTPAADIPSLPMHFLIIPVGVTVQAGIPTPGGLGGGEAVFGYLYELAHSTIAAGVLMSLVQRCIGWLLGLISYVAYLWMGPSVKPEVEAESLAA